MDGPIDDFTLRQAAKWRARLRRHDCTEADRAAYERWRDEDPRHASAVGLAGAVECSLDRLMSDERIQRLADAAAATPARPKRGWILPASLAAGLLLAIGSLQLSIHFASPTTAVAYATDRAERRSVALADGSLVELDVGTNIRVRMSASRREVELTGGRALFEVAHDASRPFTVLAGGVKTTALGTRFQVEQLAKGIAVTLTQGSVAVDDERAAWHERLQPGEQLSVDPNSATVRKRSVDVQRLTSWLRGRHVFRNTPLAEALDEVNRYAKQKIRLGDASLAELPVGGSFIAGDSRLVVEALTEVLPIRAASGGGDEIVLFRRYE